MEQLLWKIIKESREGFIDSPTQYEKFKTILSQNDRGTNQELYKIWREKLRAVREHKEFILLHIGKGGIVNAGDDGFDGDFANWIIAQGEEIFYKFQKEGHKVIIQHINENVVDYIDKRYDIPRRDYLFESFIYAFHEYLDWD